MNRKINCAALFLPALVGLAAMTGCTTKHVIFATKTQIGLDVSGTAQMPDKVSFTYGRYEGAIVPRSTNGEPYSVYGALDADVNFFGSSTIQQLFTTGEAAVIAADSQSRVEKDDAERERPRTNTKPLFFVTDSSFGLKLSAGKQDISPTLMLGYKRVEGAVIPVDSGEKEVRSVFADITINSSTESKVAVSTNAFPANKGVRIIQRFATGRAAEKVAAHADVKQALRLKSSPDSVFVAKQIVQKESGDAMKLVNHLAPNGGNVDRAKLEALANKVSVFKSQLLQLKNPATAEELKTHLKDRMPPLSVSELADNID